MSIKAFLDNIRTEDTAAFTMKRRALHTLSFFIFGMLLGLMAKYIDGLRSEAWIGDLYQPLSDISSRIGFWVLIATVIACWLYGLAEAKDG